MGEFTCDCCGDVLGVVGSGYMPYVLCVPCYDKKIMTAAAGEGETT